MNRKPQIGILPDGRRLHLHDGPIDLIIEGWGKPACIASAYRAASERFSTVLDELCSELSYLRSQCRPENGWPSGTVARRMVAAVMPYSSQTFITPMAAVAGAVAEEILETMTSAANLSRAYVNDGGDIAFHLRQGEQFVIGMVERPDTAALLGTATLKFEDPIRGIATSGWPGRSFSLGIADAVTVLADRAAAADAAATMIANAVDLPGNPAILRVPARKLAPDSDLGNRLVTQGVGELSTQEIEEALARGVQHAELLLRMGLIRASAIFTRKGTAAKAPTDISAIAAV